MTIRTAVFKVADTPADLRQIISDTYRDVFGGEGGQLSDEYYIDPNGTEWQDGEYRVLAWHNDRWGGITEILKREILVGGQPVIIGGIGGVMTHPDMRGLGLGKAVMREAHAYMCSELQVDTGMLYCEDKNLAFYASLGWQTLERKITYQQSNKIGMVDTATESENAMILSCGDFVFPDGDIDVQGRLW